MHSVQVEVTDDVLRRLGKEAVEEYLRKQVQLLKLRAIGEEIRKSLDESRFDMEQEFQQAKTEAWNEYKSQRLKDILR